MSWPSSGPPTLFGDELFSRYGGVCPYTADVGGSYFKTIGKYTLPERLAWS